MRRLATALAAAALLSIAALPTIAPGTAQAGGCDERTNIIAGPSWLGNRYGYTANIGTMPNGVDARKIITRGHHTWDDTYNDCGNKDQNNFTTHYTGTTTRRFNLADNENVVDFGPMEGIGCGTFIACIRTRSQPSPVGNLARPSFTTSDMRFSSEGLNWWTYTSNPPGNYYDLYSVAAHEAGHRLGLDHVGPSSSAQTMYGQHHAGTTYQRTLGIGDILGMRALYPSALPRLDDGDIVNVPSVDLP